MRTVYRLAQNNLLYGLIIVFAYIVASPEIQFAKTETISGKLVTQADAWSVTGNVDNAIIQRDRIGVFPFHPQRTHLFQTTRLNSAHTHQQLINIRSQIVSISPVSSTVHPNVNLNDTHKTIFYLWFENSENERILIWIIEELDSSLDRFNLAGTITVPKEAETMHVGLLLRQFDRGYSITNLEIDQLERKPIYWIGVSVLVVVALLVLARLFLVVVERNLGFIAVYTGLASGLIALGVLLPVNILKYVSLMPSLFGFEWTVTEEQFSELQNVGHIVGFVVISLFCLIVVQKGRFDLKDSIFKLCLFAVGMEILQRHSLMREPNFEDVVLNVFGVFIGIALWMLFIREKNNEFS